MPKISVVIPCYNEEKYIRNSLDSFKNQTFRDFELIVSDGGSYDNTEKIVREYTDKFIVIKDSNVVKARDAGLRIAQGEIITGADADTFYPENHLQSIWDEFQQNPEAVGVTGKARMVNGPKWGMVYWDILYSLFSFVYKHTGIVIYAPAFNMSYKRQVFLDLGGYNLNLDWGGDELDVAERLKKKGKFIFSDKLCPKTDGRRYNVGFLTFLFKHALFYYTINYISAKLLGKSIIKAKPVR